MGMFGSGSIRMGGVWSGVQICTRNIFSDEFVEGTGTWRVAAGLVGLSDFMNVDNTYPPLICLNNLFGASSS
ncbi:MAG: hypothetical protein Ct9H300mP19_16100 [Dehalococcoidia bacterium]|nr:MAG: hypothetical protein Ct9H300mP19_16100 [Dehalococcoidia bacterium]